MDANDALAIIDSAAARKRAAAERTGSPSRREALEEAALALDYVAEDIRSEQRHRAALDLDAVRFQVADHLDVSPSRVDVGWSENGEEDWSRPVYVSVGDGYGVCDLDAAPLAEQVAFLVEQVREGLR